MLPAEECRWKCAPTSLAAPAVDTFGSTQHPTNRSKLWAPAPSSHPQGTSRRFGFAKFTSPSAAQAALEALRGTRLHGGC